MNFEDFTPQTTKIKFEIGLVLPLGVEPRTNTSRDPIWLVASTTNNKKIEFGTNAKSGSFLEASTKKMLSRV